VHTRELIRINDRRAAILIGSRPGAEYAGVSDRDAVLDLAGKLRAVQAFVDRHDPDVVFTIAGVIAEAESLGARYGFREDGQPTLVRSPLTEAVEAAALRPDPLESSPLCAGVIASLGELSRLYPRKIVGATLMGPVSVAGQLLGVERMLVLSIEDPAGLRAILRVTAARVREYMEAQVAAGARYIAVNEPSGSLLSPESFRLNCLPFLKEMFAAVTLPHHLHICGHTHRHLGLMKESGAQAISIDSCVDICAAGSVFAPETVTLGNLDSAGVLLRGSPAEVTRAATFMMDAMAGIDEYIPGTSCAIPRATPAANIDAFLSVVRSR
jgi:uroporphyrinogen decarboxylase